MKGHNYAGIDNQILCQKCNGTHIHHRPLLGIPRPDAVKAKISQTKRGCHASPQTEFKKGHQPINPLPKGFHLAPETEFKLGHHLIPNFPPNYVPWNKGKQCSIEHRKKLSESHKGYIMPISQRIKIGLAEKGENHWNWQGGKSREGYSVCWTRQLRNLIRKRDNYNCQICGSGKRPLDVHHIDSNKENNHSQNLVTLCRSCHTKFHNGHESRGTFQKVVEVTE